MQLRAARRPDGRLPSVWLSSAISNGRSSGSNVSSSSSVLSRFAEASQLSMERLS